MGGAERRPCARGGGGVPRSARVRSEERAPASRRRDGGGARTARPATRRTPSSARSRSTRSLTQARALLGQIQHRLGDFAGAIRTYETLISLAPDDSRRAGDARTMAARARAARSDAAGDRLALHGVVRRAGGGGARRARRSRSSTAPTGASACCSAAPIRTSRCRSCSTPASSSATSRVRPSWAAGAYDGIIRVPMRGALDNPKELDRVLSHEFTHALVRSLAPRGVPAWLNEGLATALEAGDLEWAEQQVQRQSKPVPLRALQSGFGRFTGDAGAARLCDQRPRRAPADRGSRRLRDRQPAARSRRRRRLRRRVPPPHPAAVLRIPDADSDELREFRHVERRVRRAREKLQQISSAIFTRCSSVPSGLRHPWLY